jgi:HK97 family phage major capsid protein
MPIDLQQAQANAHVAALKAQATELKQYRTMKAATLSAMQVNKWNYDLARVLAGHNDGLEGEISAEFQRQNPNHQTNGVWVPNDVLFSRDLSVGANAGDLVSPSLTGTAVIAGLRPFSAAIAAGADVMELPVTGIYNFPREQATPQIVWGTENQALTPTSGNPSFDQTEATSLHRGSQQTKLSSSLLKVSAIDMKAYFIGSVRKSAATVIDAAVLAGTGTSNQPLGIVNAPAGSSGQINTITISDPTTWAQILAADSTVENLNAQAIDGTSAWIVNPNTKSSWKQTPKTPTSLTNGFLADNNSNTVNGHRLFTTKNVGNNAIFSTRFSSVLLVLGGAVSVLVDPFTQAHLNQVVITTDLLLDVVLRRPEAICVGATSF